LLITYALIVTERPESDFLDLDAAKAVAFYKLELLPIEWLV